jgi:hypothetical protein
MFCLMRQGVALTKPEQSPLNVVSFSRTNSGVASPRGLRTGDAREPLPYRSGRHTIKRRSLQPVNAQDLLVFE